MQHYVALTRTHVGVGGPLLVSLKPPFKGLSPNAVASITKRILLAHGVDTSVWGAHSTRGAGVLLYKRLGLSSEQVCELGQWKNVQAFTSHYLRLGAVEHAESALGSLVHRTSQGLSAEPELSRTPRTSMDEGGRDKEGEALRTCEPSQPCPRKRKAQGSPIPSLPKKVVSPGVEKGAVPLSFSFAKPPV